MADGMQNVTATGEIARAICDVMTAVKRVPKNGFNKFHQYHYATEADLLSVIRPAMAEAGLILLPSQEGATDPDDSGNVRVRVEYTLAHTSGEIWPHPLVSYGVGNDRAKNGNDGDKAIYKAVTGANKYMLFKLFQVDTGDDPEAENVSAEERPAPKKIERLTKSAARNTYETLENEMRATESRVEQEAWYRGNKDQIKSLPKDWEDLLVGEMKSRALDFDRATAAMAAE